MAWQELRSLRTPPVASVLARLHNIAQDEPVHIRQWVEFPCLRRKAKNRITSPGPLMEKLARPGSLGATERIHDHRVSP
jgi:hypothetical protein